MSNTDFQLERGSIELTLEFLSKLNVTNTDANLIFSPFSIQMCMALAFTGAKGDTAKEIANVMRYTTESSTEVAKVFNEILKQYSSSDLLKIANKIYVKMDKNIKSNYASICKEQYLTEVESINFSEAKLAAANINAWVENKTAGKICNLVPSNALDANTRLVLLNALHFKGEWKNKFAAEKTEEHEFWITANESVKTKYMNQKANFLYGSIEDCDCSVLEMPYKNSDLSMFILLPNEREGLKAMIERFNYDHLVKLTEKTKPVNGMISLSSKEMKSKEVQVKFPKFKNDFSIEISNLLKEMGIVKAFNNKADFCNILEPSEDIYISQVFHKASIEVNEEGSEAAAATATVLKKRCRKITQEFVADHPFIYWIWDKKTILFAGVFVRPSEQD